MGQGNIDKNWDKHKLPIGRSKKLLKTILKPTTRPISIRLPEYLLDWVKEKANEINILYQSLIKQYIHKGVFSSK